MPVVVVESPAKAKTINKYLGPDYTVLASYGHVRDLPAKDGSVDTEHGFGMTWEVAAESRKHVKAIADALKDDNALILATDPDREGEAISWHLEETLRDRKALKKDTPVSRVVFNAITERAVTEAMKNPREVDMELVAGLSRPPRARLPGGLQPVARALAQAARREIGRARAVGLPAPDRRARDGDRGLPRTGILDREGASGHAARAGIRGPADRAGRQEARQVRPRQCHRGRAGRSGRQFARPVRSSRSRRSPPTATPPPRS